MPNLHPILQRSINLKLIAYPKGLKKSQHRLHRGEEPIQELEGKSESSKGETKRKAPNLCNQLYDYRERQTKLEAKARTQPWLNAIDGINRNPLLHKQLIHEMQNWPCFFLLGRQYTH